MAPGVRPKWERPFPRARRSLRVTDDEAVPTAPRFGPLVIAMVTTRCGRRPLRTRCITSGLAGPQKRAAAALLHDTPGGGGYVGTVVTLTRALDHNREGKRLRK